MVLNGAGAIGYIAFIALAIWGFFKFPWWVSVVSLVAAFLVVPFFSGFSRMVIPRIVSVVLIPVLIVWLLTFYT